MKKPDSPPKDLSPAARRLWRSLVTEYGITDAGGLVILHEGLKAYDRAERCRALVDAEGETVRDRWGQAKPHPALAGERDARAQWLAALKALNLDVEPAKSPGRPPGPWR